MGIRLLEDMALNCEGIERMDRRASQARRERMVMICPESEGTIEVRPERACRRASVEKCVRCQLH